MQRTDHATTAVVLVAHGSRAEGANEAHRELIAQLSQVSDLRIWPAFLELAEPSVPAAVDDAVRAGAGRVLILPYFLYPGRHLTEDIPALAGEAADQHPEAEVAVLDHFGGDPALIGLLSAQIRYAAGR